MNRTNSTGICFGDRHRLRFPPATGNRQPFTVVLVIAQNGGYPQAGCNRAHCIGAWNDLARRNYAASLAIVDPLTKQRWIIDATPDFPIQLRKRDEIAPRERCSEFASRGAHLRRSRPGGNAGAVLFRIDASQGEWHQPGLTRPG